MIDHELRMCAYGQLAVLSHRKRQALVRDRFLLLAGVEAYQAGWPEVGARCRELLLASNPHHQLAKFSDLAAALRDPGFQQLAAQQQKHCLPERAEHLLHQLGLEPRGDQPERPRGDRMLAWLAEIWNAPTASNGASPA
jgi:hypothetical protein